MKKWICIIALFVSQTASIKAQFADTLTVIEVEKEQPTFYKIAFIKKGVDYFYIAGNTETKIYYSEIKKGMTRYIIKEKDGSYVIHLIYNAGKGYYQYMPLISFDSLSHAKSYTPDLKLFSYGFTSAGLKAYMNIPALDTVSKAEVRNFLVYQYNSSLALKNLCDYLVKHTSLRDNFKTSKSLYDVVKGKYQELTYLNWLTNNGYSAKSFVPFTFELLLSLGDKDLMDIATEYGKKIEALYH